MRVCVCVCVGGHHKAGGGGGGGGAIKRGGGGASAPNAPPMGTPLDIRIGAATVHVDSNC